MRAYYFEATSKLNICIINTYSNIQWTFESNGDGQKQQEHNKKGNYS